MATAIAFGFQDSLEDRAGTAAIIREVEDAFGPEEAIELHLDWPPQEAWAVIRPWLLSY